MSTTAEVCLAAVCAGASVALGLAAALRLHTRSVLISGYLALMSVALALRTAKLAIPGMGVYSPSGSDAPVPGSGDWWREVSQFAMAVAATALVDCSVLVVLRLWHNALLVVWADAPWWPQHVLTIVVFLSICADIIATVCLGFLDPDLINGADACKEAATMLLLSAGALWYAAQLRRCLTTLARMALGLSATSDVDHSLQRRVYGKLRVITTVSILMTAAAWLRAGLLLQFATQLVKGWSPSDAVNAAEQALYYAFTELLPAAVFAGVLVKGALARGVGRCCARSAAVAHGATGRDAGGRGAAACCAGWCGDGGSPEDGGEDGEEAGGPRVGVGRLLAGTAGLHETPGSASVQVGRPAGGGWWMAGGWSRGGASTKRGAGVAPSDRHVLLQTGGAESAFTDEGSGADGYIVGGADSEHGSVAVGDFGYYGAGGGSSVGGASGGSRDVTPRGGAAWVHGVGPRPR